MKIKNKRCKPVEDILFASNPPKLKCSICGEFWVAGQLVPVCKGPLLKKHLVKKLAKKMKNGELYINNKAKYENN